jgi:hypothetical protein
MLMSILGAHGTHHYKPTASSDGVATRRSQVARRDDRRVAQTDHRSGAERQIMSARSSRIHPFHVESRAIALEAGYPPEVLKAFMAHFHVAKIRGIPFQFTISDWWSWWQTDNRWAGRGVGSQGLVMARFNDQGPYSPENVYCVTNAQNARDIGYERRRDATLQWYRRKSGPTSSPTDTNGRQTIKFTAPQYTWLVAEAEKLGISLADLVRRIIDQHRTPKDLT